MIPIQLVLAYLFITVYKADSNIEETAKNFEKQISLYHCKDSFSLILSDSRYSISISNIKQILTYSKRKIEEEQIIYNNPLLYYVFDLEIMVKENNNQCEIMIHRPQITVRHAIDFFKIIKNEVGVYSLLIPLEYPYVFIESHIDAFEYNLFKELASDVYSEIAAQLTPFLYYSMKLSVSDLLRTNFPSDYELKFIRFIHLIGNYRYHTVEKEGKSEWPEKIKFSAIKYEYCEHETKYNSVFHKVTFVTDFYLNGHSYTSKIKIDYVSFGLFGIGLNTIEVLSSNVFLKDVIVQIFRRVYYQINSTI